MKKYYYIDDSVLLEKDFYLKIEELLQSEADLSFLVDVSVKARIADYRALGRIADALALENMINLFAALGNTLQIDTNEGFDPTPLAPMAEQGALMVLTQQQKLADVFSALGTGVQILHYLDAELVPFTHRTDENGKAFYLERDSYVNAFDIKNLTYVYAPRYGYLKLDKSKEFSGGEGVCYRPFLCSSFTLGEPVTVEPGRLTVIEGSYSMHPELSCFYDLSVFIDVSPELQRARILKRNSPKHAERFFNEWIPLENRYFETFEVKKRCTLSISVTE